MIVRKHASPSIAAHRADCMLYHRRITSLSGLYTPRLHSHLLAMEHLCVVPARGRAACLRRRPTARNGGAHLARGLQLHCGADTLCVQLEKGARRPRRMLWIVKLTFDRVMEELETCRGR